MKIIAVILAIVASVVAQELKAHAPMYSNAGSNSSEIGILNFTQPSPKGEIKINFLMKGLIRGRVYVIAVHAGNKTRNDCDSLGPVKKIRNKSFFDLAYVIVDKEYTGTGELQCQQGTLVPNLPDSIVGHAIAFYDIVKFNFRGCIPTVPSVTCGNVIQ